MQKKSNTPVQSILRFIHFPPYFSFVNKIYQTIQFSLATALLFFMTFQAVANDTILVIHSYHTEYLWTEKIKLGIDKTINKSHQDIDVYHEFMDAKRYARNDSKLYFYDYIRNKFSDTQIDLIMVSDDPALDLALQYRESLPGNPPLVFLGINNTTEHIKFIHGATGVFENHDLAKTINEIKRQTKQEKIIVINDTTESGKAHAIKMQELLSK